MNFARERRARSPPLSRPTRARAPAPRKPPRPRGPPAGSRARLLASAQALEEGRLPGAVRTDEADLVPLRQIEVDVREQEAAAVGLRDALEAHDPRTRGACAGGEGEGGRGGRGRFRPL